MKFRFEDIEKEKEEEIENLREKRSLIKAIEKAKKEGRIPVIAEYKTASPSRGSIRRADPILTARSMEDGGACAISVLTDKNFKGKICHLRKIKNTTNIPVLRKDFIVDTFQLYESRGNGADAVLLIASLLKNRTREFLDKTHELGMEALVEVRDEKDLPYAIKSGARLIGINNRDLKTFKMDLSTTEKLAANIPDDRIIVSESGMETIEDEKRLLSAGADAFLIGTTIMKSENIKEKVRELTGT